MTGQRDRLDRNCWENLRDEEREQVFDFNKGYIHFLSRIKTERESVEYLVDIAKDHGFVPLNRNKSISPGEKLLYTHKNKVCAFIVMGQEPLINGINLVASHIDSPRLDLKVRPLYEEDGLALLKTHYYGGIKKYQWLSIPLSLHGVVVKKDGTVVKIVIGEKDNEPVFTISDLLPHLAKAQMEKKMSEAISGEGLNILSGSIPAKDIEKDPVKQMVLDLIKEQYGFDEEDFTSAEIQAVPAYKAREVGLDKSLVGAYGQDDRVSAYTSMQAILDIKNPVKTAICLFADKEEIGSVGNTGLNSLLLENLIAELASLAGEDSYTGIRKCLANSHALSADVNAAVDPNYPDVFEKRNCSFLTRGVVLTKFTGSRGKSESSDANPEFLAQLRYLFDEANVCWQVGELGKVDIGGGGTVAQYLAYYGMEVADCGVAVMGMHSPFEIVSKADVYMAYRAYHEFLQSFC